MAKRRLPDRTRLEADSRPGDRIDDPPFCVDEYDRGTRRGVYQPRLRESALSRASGIAPDANRRRVHVQFALGLAGRLSEQIAFESNRDRHCEP
jgi:hypothetical protein